MPARILSWLVVSGLSTLPLVAACAPDGTSYGATGTPTDPWGTFWSVLIVVLTFFVGFLVGATVSRNGGIRISTHRHRHHRRTQAGWNRIARQIQDGTRHGLTEWRSLGHTGHIEDPDWNELSRTIEERILEEMHRHHD